MLQFIGKEEIKHFDKDTGNEGPHDGKPKSFCGLEGTECDKMLAIPWSLSLL